MCRLPVAALFVSLCWGTSALAQASPGAKLPSLPFEQWISEGPHTGIPWKIEIGNPRLGISQRIGLWFRVEVSRKTLNQSPVRDLVFYARMADRSGRWLTAPYWSQTRWDKPLPPDTSLDIRMQMLVLPGAYNLTIVLCDRVTGQRSVAVRQVNIPPLSKDPLPQSHRHLPLVEFVTYAEGPERFFQPDAVGRLWLPLEASSHVSVDVLANFGPSDQYQGWRFMEQTNQGVMLAAVRTLSQIKVANGSLRIVALDLLRRNVLFEQQNVQSLEWTRLRDALKAANPSMISAEALRRRLENADYFRQQVLQYLSGGPRTRAQANPPPSPLSSLTQGPPTKRILIILSGGLLFPRGSRTTPLPPLEDSNLRVYHLRFRLYYGHFGDDIARILKPLRPRTFDIQSPMDFRKAIAQILADSRNF